MIPLSKVLQGIGDYSLLYPAVPGISFTGVSNDSRMLQPGNLFVALKGARDGHDFIPHAFARGARGVLAERTVPLQDWLPDDRRDEFAYIIVRDSLEALQRLSAFWLARHRHNVDVIAVTGSVGKTTTKEMVATVLSQRFTVLKNERNLNNEIGLPLTVMNLGKRHDKVVLEMGMYALGEIAALCEIAKPRIGVVTNVGPTHLERLGTIERIAEAKSELVQALPDDGVAVLNGDDPRVLGMRGLARCQVMTFGLGDSCSVRATEVSSMGLKGLQFKLVHEGQQAAVATTLVGQHNVYPCLAAAAVGFASEMSIDEITTGLARSPSTVRIDVKSGRNGSTIIDDSYNASPLSTIAALNVLGEMPGQKTAILGDMAELGSYEERGHREVGERAARVVDRLIVVGARARWIGSEAATRGLLDVQFFDTTSQVSYEPSAGEFILVKGSRGMRMEEIVSRLLPPEHSGNGS
mgnify:CR=1 FL=1